MALLAFRRWIIMARHWLPPITCSLVAYLAIQVLGLYRAAFSAALAQVAKDQASDARPAALAWVARTIEAAAIQSSRSSEYLFASMLSPDEKTSRSILDQHFIQERYSLASVLEAVYTSLH
jgi:hypothetical protein